MEEKHFNLKTNRQTIHPFYKINKKNFTNKIVNRNCAKNITDRRQTNKVKKTEAHKVQKTQFHDPRKIRENSKSKWVCTVGRSQRNR